jgi:hypothetical protein
MSNESRVNEDLLERVRAGEEAAFAALFAEAAPRLRRMVRLRMDRRLQGRVDASDVLQEAWLDAARRLPEYAANPVGRRGVAIDTVRKVYRRASGTAKILFCDGGVAA